MSSRLFGGVAGCPAGMAGSAGSVLPRRFFLYLIQDQHQILLEFNRSRFDACRLVPTHATMAMRSGRAAHQESLWNPRESSRLEFETIIQQQETTRKEEEEAHSPAQDRGRELCLELLSCRECLPFRSSFSHIYRKRVAPACFRNPFEKLSLGWKQARERERRTRVTYCCIP